MAPYRETAQCLHLKRERMSEYLMKWKKWIALALSAVMAVSMLTACGGGGGSINTSQVNSILKQAGSEITVTSPSELKTAVQNTAKEMTSRGSIIDSVVATTKLNNKMGEPLMGLMFTSGKFCMAFSLSERVIETGGEASAMASMLGLSNTNFGNLGWVDTPEGVAAAIVLGIDGGIETYVNKYLKLLPSGVSVNADYAVSATRMYDSNNVAYWLFGVEISASWASGSNNE